MKNILLFFFLCLTASLIGQTRQDTVFSRWGQIANIKHFSKIDTDNASKAYLFQRGLTFGDEAWQLDSISAFDDKGIFIRTRLISELDPAKRTDSPRPNRQQVQLYDEEVLNSDIKLVRVSGYAGQQQSRSVSFTVTDQETAQFSIIDGPDNVKIAGRSKPASQNRHELNLEIKLPAGYRQEILRLQGPEGKTFDVRLALRGYDLTEKDFVATKDLSKLKYLDAQERENIYLRLESTEKLLSIYWDETVRYRLPVGRQVDVIPVYHLPPGDYRMEIIDLSTGTRRSYGLRR